MYCIANRWLRSSSDVVVLVMGLTGVGKSTFIEKVTGEDAGVGHSLLSGPFSFLHLPEGLEAKRPQ